MLENRRIYGHIRFSFYGVTDTRAKPNSDGTALARLYDEGRMARRFFMFENLTLPSLIYQTDRDFRTVILSSSLMPDRYKERLSALALRLPGAVVEYSDYKRGDLAIRKYMAEAAGYKARYSSVHFRLDDDDALSINYIARLREISRVVSPSTHITFPDGIFLFPVSSTEPVGTSIRQQRFLTAIGLATVNGGSFHKNPFQMMHGKVWTRWPVVSDPSFLSHIRSQHFDNDTAATQDRILAALQLERSSRRRLRYASEVERGLAQAFPWIDRPTLDGLIERCRAVNGMADLSPIV